MGWLKGTARMETPSSCFFPGSCFVYFWSKGLRSVSDKPSHKHDSNKYQTKAFVICDHKSDQTISATHVNKAYLVWLMYWSLFNQHYQHRTNQKLRSWALRASFSFAPLSLPPSFLCFFFSRHNLLHELARKRLLCRPLTDVLYNSYRFPLTGQF